MKLGIVIEFERKSEKENRACRREEWVNRTEIVDRAELFSGVTIVPQTVKAKQSPTKTIYPMLVYESV